MRYGRSPIYVVTLEGDHEANVHTLAKRPGRSGVDRRGVAFERGRICGVNGITPQHSPYRTKAEFAAETIRDAIYGGRLAPGSRLVLRRLESDMGLSITPIREALQLLVSQGLVTQEPHHGFSVAELDPTGVDETYWLRAILEPLATRIATRLLTDADLDRLTELSRRMVQAIDAHEQHDMQDANHQFHMSIYAAAQKPRLLEHIRLLWRMSPFGSLRMVRERPRRSIEEHGLLLAALRKRDPEAAERAMYLHIEEARTGILNELAERCQPGPAADPPTIEGRADE